MNLEILSLHDALNYEPTDRTYAIRIRNGFSSFPVENFLESVNWISSKVYCFDDVWPGDWKEYTGLDFNEPVFSRRFGKTWEHLCEGNQMTRGSFLSFIETRGAPDGRYTIFGEDIAKSIMSDFESVKSEVDTVLIHCNRGKNRSPSVGIAMNEIYGWKIRGLKEKFPEYRRFVYQKMIDAATKQNFLK